MSLSTFKTLCAATALSCAGLAAHAQVQQCGPNVNLEQARRALAGAIADARKPSLPMAVAVVDAAGQRVAFQRMGNTQTVSVGVAQDKAVSAAMYRRPTKVFQEVLAAAGPGLRVLKLRNANAVEGGVPPIVDG